MKMKMVLIGAVSCALAAVATWRFATPQLETTAVPGLYVRARTIDLGMVDPAEGATTQFEFVNRGQVSLLIDDVTTDCGCTTSGSKGRVISAVDVFRLPVSLIPAQGSRHRGGQKVRFRHRVIVQVVPTDTEKDATPSIVALTVTGGLECSNALMAVIPAKLHFGEIRVGQEARRSLQFEGPEAVLDAIPSEIVIAPGERYRIQVPVAQPSSTLSTKVAVVILSPAAHAGPLELKGSIFLESKESKRPLLVVPVTTARCTASDSSCIRRPAAHEAPLRTGAPAEST
jgi:hypothetical protein